MVRALLEEPGVDPIDFFSEASAQNLRPEQMEGVESQRWGQDQKNTS